MALKLISTNDVTSQAPTVRHKQAAAATMAGRIIATSDLLMTLSSPLC